MRGAVQGARADARTIPETGLSHGGGRGVPLGFSARGRRHPGLGPEWACFHFSDTWQLVVNTGTTIVTFLVVFLIQGARNRDSRALHLKLDELLRAVAQARTSLVALESRTDDELDRLQQEFDHLPQVQGTRLEACPDVAPPALQDETASRGLRAKTRREAAGAARVPQQRGADGDIIGPG